MTTIAYRDGVLAADTQTTGAGHRIGHTRKIGGVKGLLWGASGDAAWGKRFRDWVATGLNGEPPEPPDENCGGAIILPDDAVLCVHKNGIERRFGLPFWADGSGADYALGAMQVGASAPEAVRAAMAWDTRTGGEITVLRRRGGD